MAGVPCALPLCGCGGRAVGTKTDMVLSKDRFRLPSQKVDGRYRDVDEHTRDVAKRLLTWVLPWDLLLTLPQAELTSAASMLLGNISSGLFWLCKRVQSAILFRERTEACVSVEAFWDLTIRHKNFRDPEKTEALAELLRHLPCVMFMVDNLGGTASLLLEGIDPELATPVCPPHMHDVGLPDMGYDSHNFRVGSIVPVPDGVARLREPVKNMGDALAGVEPLLGALVPYMIIHRHPGIHCLVRSIARAVVNMVGGAIGVQEYNRLSTVLIKTLCAAGTWLLDRISGARVEEWAAGPASALDPKVVCYDTVGIVSAAVLAVARYREVRPGNAATDTNTHAKVCAWLAEYAFAVRASLGKEWREEWGPIEPHVHPEVVGRLEAISGRYLDF